MPLLMVSLLIDGLILLVNSPVLVKNEKKPFVLVQTPRTRMDVRALGVGRGGRRLLIGQETLFGHAQPWRGAVGGREPGARPWGGSGLRFSGCNYGSFYGRWGVCACSCERANACETHVCPQMCP